MAELRKYAALLDAATAGSVKIRKSLRKTGETDFAVSADWTPAAGEVLVSKDGGAEANIGTLPAYANGAWEFVLTAAELTSKVTRVRVSAAAVDDDETTVETFGHASAMYPDNYATDLVGPLPTAIENADALLARGLPASPTTDTVGEALAGARAQAFGKWVVAGDTLSLYASNGTTLLKSFTLAPSGGPFESRTPA